ncbi:alpha/beta hydrolase family esterase [Methylibium sp.]|uniref:alpha/beta hydrolase family esterase n=1 Tax=Methylibium sp. TaxID=2067992 RepID=UPI003D111228
MSTEHMRVSTMACAAVIMLGACGVGGGNAEDGVKPYKYPARHVVACQDSRRARSLSEPQLPSGPVRYRVKAPANYDPSFAHPLLVVFSAAGADAGRTERYTHLTPAATEQGFVVAYVDHHTMSKNGILALGRVVRDVEGQWCIDRGRVFMAGHSDGGTAATALALLPETRADVHGIAVSAAGFRTEDLEQLGCRDPIPVMVMHGVNDKLFPGWGEQAAKWWASCNGCGQQSGFKDPARPECRAYERCPSRAPVLYCELPTAHNNWPGLHSRMVGFLLGPEPH